MRVLKLLLLIGLAINPAAEANADEIRYYSGIAGIISPFLDYKPKGAISAGQAAGINHYRFSFDGNGRVNSIRFFQEDKPSNDAYFYAHEVRYSYDGNQVVRRYFDRSGHPMAMWRHYYGGGEIQQEVFTRKGDRRTLHLFDKDSKPVESKQGSYRFEAHVLNEHQFVQTQFRKDGSENVLTEYFPFKLAKITTDHRGYLHTITNVVAPTYRKVQQENAGFAEVEFDFNEAGAEMGWWFLDDKGRLANRAAAIVDPGYAKWLYDVAWHNRSLDLKASFTMHFHDKNDRRISNSDGVYAMRYTQDAKGNTSSMETINRQGMLMDHPVSRFARSETSRNPDGQRSEVRYYDSSLKLVKQGRAIERFIYDAEGNLSETMRLDSAGMLIKP
jgi:hypothetical protein